MTDRIVELRKRAEMSVRDMPEGDLKLKAFEVAFSHLLRSEAPGAASPQRAEPQKPSARRHETKGSPPSSVAERILTLRDEGFFADQKTIKQTRDELRAHGWHYPLTSLSGRLQSLVQRRALRREQIKDGSKSVWKYSNP